MKRPLLRCRRWVPHSAPQRFESPKHTNGPGRCPEADLLSGDLAGEPSLFKSLLEPEVRVTLTIGTGTHEVTNTGRARVLPSLQMELALLAGYETALVFNVRSIRFGHCFSSASAVSLLTFQGNVSGVNLCHGTGRNYSAVAWTT